MISEENKERIKRAKQAAEREDVEEAARLAHKVLNEVFEEPNSLYFAGQHLLAHNKIGLAHVLFRRLAELQPDKSEVWNELGRCYQEGHDPDIAYKCFQRSLHLKPRGICALNNMALIHINTNEPEQALELVDKSLSLDAKPGDKLDALDNKALALLSLGEWEEGFNLYEHTLGHNKHRTERLYTEPEGIKGRWAGEKGKTVVCYGEQGIGDEISFGSCIPDLIRDSKKVVIDCEPKLEGLFKRSFPEADVYGTRYKTDNTWPLNYKFDSRVALSSLAKYYRKKTEDFPGTPYLKADPERRVQWRALLDTLPGLKVGIAWNGGLTITGRVRRSLKLEQLMPILAQKASFISLEYNDASEEIERLEKRGIKVHQWPRATLTDDYDDTAALVSELDLVISVTTAVIHLAGALGKECWTLVPPRPRWFYGFGDSIPWYKSVQLFRHNGRWPIHILARRLRCRV